MNPGIFGPLGGYSITIRSWIITPMQVGSIKNLNCKLCKMRSRGSAPSTTQGIFCLSLGTWDFNQLSALWSLRNMKSFCQVINTQSYIKGSLSSPRSNKLALEDQHWPKLLTYYILCLRCRHLAQIRRKLYLSRKGCLQPTCEGELNRMFVNACVCAWLSCPAW